MKPGLAMAYAVKKRSGKKMAKGGKVPAEDLSMGHDPIHGEQMHQDDEDLMPMREPEQGAKHAVMKQMDYGMKAQEHEELPESKVDPSSINAYREKGNPIHMAAKIAQRKMPLSEQGAHMAHGGQIKEAMSRRDRALMAARGLSHAEQHENKGYSANEAASKSDGPEGQSTKMPLSPEEVKKGPPDSFKISEEEQAMFANGGMAGELVEYPDPELPMSEQDRFYADGGIMRGPKSIAMGIMKKKMAKGGMAHYAEGGPVDGMGLQDQEVDPDQFMSEFMPEQHYDHVSAMDSGDAMADELHDPKGRRKKQLDSIMSGLHAKHLGK